MNFIERFFLLEQTEGGWRTWFFWVLMTNIGFFSGLWLGGVFTGSINDKLLQAVVAALIIGGLTGLAQAVVLQRHKISGRAWMLATTLGWGVGIGGSGLILFRLDPAIATDDFLRWVLPASFIAGAVVGVPQALVLANRWPGKLWQWILISCVGWGIQFPGILPGYFWVRGLNTADGHD